MPYIEPRRNQNGEITSYRLVVSAGLDQNGKQIRRRSLWTPPTRGMSEAQMEREATAAAYNLKIKSKKATTLTTTKPLRNMPSMFWN